MARARKPRTKKLSTLKDTARGDIHHVSIEPSRTKKGSFTTRIHRGRSPAAQAAMDHGGSFTPEPAPIETGHPDYPGVLAHVGTSLGATPDPDGADQSDGDGDDDA
jgi:hypothetical protein